MRRSLNLNLQYFNHHNKSDYSAEFQFSTTIHVAKNLYFAQSICYCFHFGDIPAKTSGNLRTCQAEDWAMRRSGANNRTIVLMAIFCVMIAGGCNSLQTSGIDPTGEHVLTAPPANVYPSNPAYQEPPVSPLPWDPVTLILTPSVSVAPVGSEVVLIAGVGSADGYLRCNQRLEWSIAPGSVGQFVDIGKNDFVDILLGDYNRPRLVNSVFAIGSTASKDQQVRRGPTLPAEEISIIPGQGWIKITSPIEGTSIVAVADTKIVNGAQRTKTATIYWTDATWRFPPPSINPAGTKHVFTTTVMRQTNQCPCPGWRVKYTITGGPAAGFSPDGASSIEATTDAAGQANAEIFQKTPAHGTNQIGIEVIRPAELPGAGGQRTVVGMGSTMHTWTAADIAVKLSGPSMTQAGSTLTYRLDVSNPGDLPTKNIIVTNVLPDGLSYLSSNTPAAIGGKQLQWRLNELGPRQKQTIEIVVRAEKEGSVNNCAEVMTAGGLKVSDCATTTITAAASAAGAPATTAPPPSASSTASSLISLQIFGPNMATIGSEVSFNIVITNRSQSNIDKLIVKDRFDPGLEHSESPEKRSIESTLGDIPPSRYTKLPVTFRVTKAGNLCHTVEVVRQGTVLASARSCVPVSAQSAPPPGIASPGGRLPPRTSPDTTQGTAPGSRPQTTPGLNQGTAPTNPSPSAVAGVPVINIKLTGPQPQQRTVGDKVSFVSQISNPNNRPLNNLKVVYRFDPALVPKLATDRYQVEGGNLVWLIPLLPAGGAMQFEVQYECTKATYKASNTVSVSSREGAQAQADASVEIRYAPGSQSPGGTTPGGPNAGGTLLPGPAKSGENQPGENRPGGTPTQTIQSANPLTLTVTALHTPVAAGKELSYDIRVLNNSNVVQRQVIVTAIVPDGMIPALLGTTGPGSTQFDIDRQTVSFNPVMTVQPGETLTYRVRVRTKSASQIPFRFRVKLTSQNLSQPIEQEAETEVF
jgi:uncharacterized repeat protein (TIGR01451 family)